MEVNFSSAELAAIMLRPSQAHVQKAYLAAQKATLQNAKEAEAAAKLEREATRLGHKLDIKA